MGWSEIRHKPQSWHQRLKAALLFPALVLKSGFGCKSWTPGSSTVKLKSCLTSNKMSVSLIVLPRATNQPLPHINTWMVNMLEEEEEHEQKKTDAKLRRWETVNESQMKMAQNKDLLSRICRKYRSSVHTNTQINQGCHNAVPRPPPVSANESNTEAWDTARLITPHNHSCNWLQPKHFTLPPRHSSLSPLLFLCFHITRSLALTARLSFQQWQASRRSDFHELSPSPSYPHSSVPLKLISAGNTKRERATERPPISSLPLEWCHSNCLRLPW